MDWLIKGLDSDGLKVYAPMEVEPSHFYLAKYGLAGKVQWDRTLPPDFTAEKAAAKFKEGGYDYMLLPDSPFSCVRTDFPAIVKDLEKSQRFPVTTELDYHGNRLVLFGRDGR